MASWDLHKSYTRPWPRFNPDPNSTSVSIPDGTVVSIDDDLDEEAHAPPTEERSKRGRAAIGEYTEQSILHTLDMSPRCSKPSTSD